MLSTLGGSLGKGGNVRLSRRHGGDRGATAVETALILPLVLLPIVYGIVYFGILLTQQQALGNGARQAARLGVVAGHNCTQIINEARNASGTILISSASVNVTVRLNGSAVCSGTPTAVPCSADGLNDQLTVETNYLSSPPLVPAPSPASVSLNGSGVFRCEF
jgi:Flp pilus assembly protein TadG